MNSTFGQIVFSGTVLTENSIPISNASIVIEIPDNNENLGFVLSDDKGFFKIEIKSISKNLKIIINALDFEKKEFNVDNITQNKTIILKSFIIQLEEVKVETKIVEKKGDTLTYNLKAFEGKEDRSLADVLKKIPGLTVDENGKVEYQGTPINKFYVEGKDLMSGAYGTLNLSLPKDAVTKIQVLEQHQPIKMLQDLVPSYQAGINVKLKKEITLTGSSEIGAGGNIKFVRQLSITPMVFTKKYQYLIDFKSNNSGSSVQNQLNVFSFDEDFEGLTLQSETGHALSLFQIAIPRVHESRYLFNDINLGAINFLTSLSKEWELKSKVSFFSNIVRRNESQFVNVNLFDSIGIKTSSINYNRKNNLFFKENQLNSQFILTKNTKKSFVKNTFDFQSNSKNDFGNTLLDNNTVLQEIISPSFSIQNSLSGIFRIKGELINLKTTLNFISDNQVYNTNPYSSISSNELPVLSNIQNIIQKLNSKNFSLNHEISYIFSIKKLILNPSINFKQDYKTVQTNIIGENSNKTEVDFGNNFRNDTGWSKNSLRFQIATNFKNESCDFKINFPIIQNNIKIINSISGVNKNLKNIVFEPNFNFRYIFNSDFSSLLTGSIFNSFGDISNHTSNVVFSALNTSKQNSNIQQNRNTSISNRFTFKIIEKNIELYLNLKYTIMDSNNSNSQSILQNGQTDYSLMNFNNKTNNTQIVFNLSKSIPKLKTSFSINYNLSIVNNFNIINNQVSDIRNFSNGFDLSFNSNYFSWLTFNNNVNFTHSNRSNNLNVINLKNVTEFIFFPIKNHSIAILTENYVFKFNNTSYNNDFFDLTYQYSMSKRKIDLGIAWQNILNLKNYVEVDVNDVSSSLSQFQLRPSQIMLNLRFNF